MGLKDFAVGEVQPRDAAASAMIRGNLRAERIRRFGSTQTQVETVPHQGFD